MSDARAAAPGSALELTLGELAERIDAPLRDALSDAIRAGVQTFSHDGHRLDADEVESYLKSRQLFDPLPELEFALTPNQVKWLAAMADVEPSDLMDATPAAKPLRKFVASESELREVAAKRQARSS